MGQSCAAGGVGTGDRMGDGATGNSTIQGFPRPPSGAQNPVEGGLSGGLVMRVTASCVVVLSCLGLLAAAGCESLGLGKSKKEKNRDQVSDRRDRDAGPDDVI